MNVQELIDELQKIEDKTRLVYTRGSSSSGCCCHSYDQENEEVVSVFESTETERDLSSRYPNVRYNTIQTVQLDIY